ncbi:hypothetical protein XMM379_002245 [Aliiroseovarius sp. xm-m-379]|uniref:Uncharacterized protein n=1 Tax=Aliiroseovarius crassostreae TaxID=154981 RepID=A0A0P7IYP7_9RHOB|nr:MULTISPECIES: hypothetical protein [Aliiroseovarius]KPN64961.1 hypothetical protein AKJ29_07040 [Aliiroseovarius crassostreae]NRP13808.1 hypothetical protein [Aliiroseovarius sp. xm-d-517]NRP25547.1 hypothetical protein [Aliiroseovarius sp. xm-m-379]NRP29540.1 hypothetical protein [Aliiroseovarius sp. xm-m-314]NRP34346.1 hypothetical protein [Aliiroseovarius sp. xm-a-104]
MREISHLYHKEAVRLDRDQLEILLLQLGPTSADKLVNQALEDLAIGLAQIKKHHAAGQVQETREQIRALKAIAQKLGMTTLARICRDARDLVGSPDIAGCAAVLARLNRIGEGSLIAVWDLQDMSV